MLSAEGDYYSYIRGMPSSEIDNYMDSTMLMIAGYNGTEDIISQVIYNYYIIYPDKQRTESLHLVGEAYLDGDDNGTEKKTYEWYWHGYLVVLKPLLQFFSVADLRRINSILILCEVVFVSLLLYKNTLHLYCIPFLISVSFMNLSTVALSISYSLPFHITIISMVAELLFPRWIQKNSIMLYCTIGALTSYLDFLTYPIITLVFPLVIYLSRNKQRLFVKTLGNITSWGIGYIGMWTSKWLISTVITKQNHFIKGFERISVRSANVYNNTSLGVNEFINIMQRYVKQSPYLFLIFGFVIILLIILLKQKHLEQNRIVCSAIMLCCSLLPLLWYVISRQHSYIHNHFTFRAMSGSFFVIGSFLIPLLEQKQVNKVTIN